MPDSTPEYATVDDWIACEATPFSLDASESFNAAVDKTVSVLGGSVDLLGRFVLWRLLVPITTER